MRVKDVIIHIMGHSSSNKKMSDSNRELGNQILEQLKDQGIEMPASNALKGNLGGIKGVQKNVAENGFKSQNPS